MWIDPSHPLYQFLAALITPVLISLFATNYALPARTCRPGAALLTRLTRVPRGCARCAAPAPVARFRLTLTMFFRHTPHTSPANPSPAQIAPRPLRLHPHRLSSLPTKAIFSPFSRPHPLRRSPRMTPPRSRPVAAPPLPLPPRPRCQRIHRQEPVARGLACLHHI
ncbi:hypothetical protein DFH06DRAFT_1221853 [Mycena polygramma]|nr:hypothetical protein DFH06DRAFT_1221853 [Mycena polygramma]